MNEEEIFHEVLARRPEERAVYVEQACAGEPELRAAVEALLRANVGATGFLEQPAPAPVATIDERLRERPGTVIGPYKLIETIGEGGMGTVWMAQQQEPVKRLVALKVIKPGMDSKQVMARFEAERQALALMDHPNIARVFDAGTTDTGRPYFVMELVKGAPLTKYCDEHRLTPKERLELFIPVCQAIQHAHQKGIIHRDIKPSNVLVALYDGKPVPRVIDFGVAKATGQQLTEHTLVTGFGAVVGTLEYMSPEQAELNQLDIDTRSDIYSLGVLLYELLTGSTPLDRKRLKEAAMLELLRIIREEEPPKPSTRLSTTEEMPSIAANRGLEPKKLSGLVRGELDWIVMKALEKDRNRRYETANGFAQDIQRYLADEPVQACPPSVSYRLRKFARRNSGRLTAAAVVGVALLVAVGGIGWAVRDRAAVAEQVAHDKAAQREKLEGRISQALDETRAEYERDNLPEALARIQRIDALLGGDTEVSDEIRQCLEQWRAELRILQRLEDLALLLYERSQLLQRDAAYACVFRDIGIDIDALPAEEAGRRIRTHVTWKRLTEALDEWALLRQDIPFLKPPPPDAWPRKWHLLQVARAADPDELRSQARLAAEKWDLAAAERLARSPEVGRLPAAALRHLAMVIYYGNTDGNTQAGRDSAVRLLLNALILRPEDLRLNATCANWYGRMKPPRWAEAAHYRSIAVALRPGNPVLRVMLAWALRAQGRLDDAVAQNRTAISLDPNSALAHSALGYALDRQGKRDEAIAEYRKAIELNPNDDLAHSNLGGALLVQGKLDEAIAECWKAIELDPAYAPAHSNLGGALRKQRKLDEAIAQYRKAIELDPKLAAAHNGLGNALADKGKVDEAIAEYRKGIELDPKDALAHCNLGRNLEQQGDFREALKELRRGHELGSRRPGWPYASAQWLRQCERRIELDAKLPGFLAGKNTPANPAERIELAELSARKRLHRAAARFYEEAFAAEPKLVAANRYNAACAAVQAGCGQSKDTDKLDDKERTRLRRQALDWLRAELEVQRLLLDKDANRACAGVLQRMRFWQGDGDFALVRGRNALARLPQAERLQWQKLWQEVAALRITAGKINPEHVREDEDWLLKEETAPGTLIKLRGREADFCIRYPERRAKIPADPILYLTFDQDTVQVKGKKLFVADLSGNGNHGVGEGVKYSPAGKLGGCLELAEKLRLSRSLMNRLPEYTFTAWMYQDQGQGPVYGEFDANDAIVYELTWTMFVNSWNRSRKDNWKGGQPAGLAVPPGQWYFAAVRLQHGGVDQGTVDIFVNGKSYEIPGQMMGADASVFGVFRGGGRIDEVAVYDRALSDDEIRVLSELPAQATKPLNSGESRNDGKR